MRIRVAKGNPITVFFVRHGEYEGQNGTDLTDSPLTELGHRQAEKVAKRLAEYEFDHIYCSTLLRASQTAEPIVKALTDVPYTETPELVEVCQHHFLTDPVDIDMTLLNEVEGEHDVMVRFINRLRHAHDQGGNVLVVAHGNIILSLMALMGGKKPHQSVLIALDNASVSIVQYWSLTGRSVISTANSTSHLSLDELTA